MNEQFEYNIRKILNRILLHLMSFILLSAILIILVLLFELPLLFPLIFIGLYLAVVIFFNYRAYRRNTWLLNHYKTNKKEVIEKLEQYPNQMIFNNRINKYYEKARKALEDDTNELKI